MDLLFIGTNNGPGGTETHFVTMVTAMSDAGHRVGAVVRQDDFIHEILSRNPQVRLFHAAFRRRNDLESTLAVWRACDRFRPEVIIGTFEKEYPALMLIAWRKRVPLVLFRHLEEAMKRGTQRLVPHFVKSMVAPSRYLRARLIEQGISEKVATVLYNPLDTNHFRPSDERRRKARLELGVKDHEVLVTYVGRFERQKGVFTLNQAIDGAMNQCLEVRMLWVGHGEAEPELAAAVASSSNAGRHLWSPWTSDVLSCYCASDIVVLPSERNETFGRTLIEAQSCAVSVVGSDCGGIPETMLPGVSGILAPPGDVAGWRAAIVELAGSRRMRDRFGVAGRNFVRTRFNSAIIATEFDALLQGLIRPHDVRGSASRKGSPNAVQVLE